MWGPSKLRATYAAVASALWSAHLLLPSCSLAVPLERAILTRPGYTITLLRSGEVRVDFVLNQKGISRPEIESGFSGYPREKVRKKRLDPKSVNILFRELESPAFAVVAPEYLAPKGTFAYYGHRVIMTLTLEARPGPARTITFDSSRRNDWPEPLRQTVDHIFRLASETGPPPVGPFID